MIATQWNLAVIVTGLLAAVLHLLAVVGVMGAFWALYKKVAKRVWLGFGMAVITLACGKALMRLLANYAEGPVSQTLPLWIGNVVALALMCAVVWAGVRLGVERDQQAIIK